MSSEEGRWGQRGRLKQDSASDEAVAKSHSRIRLFVTPRTPLSLGILRQEYWSGLQCPPPGDLPNPGIKPWPPPLQADSLPAELPGMKV